METHERNLAQCFHIDSPEKAGQPQKDNRNTDNPEDRESEVSHKKANYVQFHLYKDKMNT